jgi:hypothetical protein
MTGKFTFLLWVSFSAESSLFVTYLTLSLWKIIASSFEEDYSFLCGFVLIDDIVKGVQG